MNKAKIQDAIDQLRNSIFPSKEEEDTIEHVDLYLSDFENLLNTIENEVNS